MTGTLIALLMFIMVFQVAMAEDQAPAVEASQEAVQAEETPAEPAAEPSCEPSAQAEPQDVATGDAQPAVEPEAAAVSEDAAADLEGLEAEHEALELVEIPDEKVPLAGGQEPSVAVRVNRDITSLQIGDSLVLTSELNGFSGTEYTIRWQARVNGQWKDLEGEHSTKLVVKVTGDNADWSYRVAVDAQPVE